MESPENNALKHGSFRLGLATVSQLALHPEFTEELAALIRRDGGSERAVRALHMEFLGRGLEKTIAISENATAEDIIAEAKAAFVEASIPFTYFASRARSIIERDLELVKGKTLQVLTHNFGLAWTMERGCDLQKDEGFDGNAAAFLVWLTQKKWKSMSVSIANTNDRLFRNDEGTLFAPYSNLAPDPSQVEDYCEFGLSPAFGEWSVNCRLVAFRAI